MHGRVNFLKLNGFKSCTLGNEYVEKLQNLLLNIEIAVDLFLYNNASVQTETHSFSLCTEAQRNE